MLGFGKRKQRLEAERQIFTEQQAMQKAEREKQQAIKQAELEQLKERARPLLFEQRRQQIGDCKSTAVLERNAAAILDVLSTEPQTGTEIFAALDWQFFEVSSPLKLTNSIRYIKQVIPIVEKYKDQYSVHGVPMHSKIAFAIADLQEVEKAIEQAECRKEQEKHEQQQQHKACCEIYEHFMADAQCKIAIGNFIKYHLETLTKIVTDWEDNAEAFESDKANVSNDAERIRIYGVTDNFLETVNMLTKALVEDTDFSFDSAKPVVKQILIISLLNKWITDFQNEEEEFIEELDFSDKDECIKQFVANDILGGVYEAEFACFLLIYDVKLGFDTSLSYLHEMKEEFDKKFSDEIDKMVIELEEEKETTEYENFKASLFTYIDTKEGGESFSIDDIDGMDGAQFEYYIAKLFEKMGYETEVTKHSGDQGIDVIAKNDIVTIGIQAKCYSGAVGNSAIQEAVGGKALYKVDKIMVITNSEFTSGAKELAKANNVELWDRIKLKEKIKQYIA